jgi:hypothetical protein
VLENGPILTLRSFPKNVIRAPFDEGCSPPPSFMMPAAVSSWLYLPMASINSLPGIAPVSEVLVVPHRARPDPEG